MRAGNADPPRHPVMMPTPSAAASASDEPRSPCIRHCCLDEADICLGCGRHVDEITGWHNADEGRKREILEQASVRRARRAARYAGGT
jgi:predicted Fe-S protein YdhL (DUF1289 family)